MRAVVGLEFVDDNADVVLDDGFLGELFVSGPVTRLYGVVAVIVGDA